MKILLVSKYLHYPQGGGGLERNTHELCLRLLKHGVTPAVMCDLSADYSPLMLRNRLARRLNPRIRFPVDRGLGYPVYRGWSEDDGAAEVMQRFRPDVVIAQSAEPVPILRQFEGMGVPLMAYFHEVERVWDAGTIAAMGDVGLLANSEFTARKMRENGAATLPTVIRPLIDPSFYRTARTPKSVLFVNAKPHKGVEVAFAIAERRPDVQFDFTRPWNMKPAEVQALKERARAVGNITLHEPTNNMRSLYARARLLLAPSQWEEAWGRVATEAQVNGEYGSQASKLNGPRHFVMDHSAAEGSSASGEIFTFGGIQAKLVARLTTQLGEPTVGDEYYRPNRVQRETQWTYDRGKLIYKLIDPSGAIYVMQSYAQIVDPNLTIDQLADLGSRLNLPEGWRFETRRLRHTMTMTAEGMTSVVNDELLNTYQVMRKSKTRIGGAPRGCIAKRTTLRVHVDGDTALTRVFVGGRRVAQTTDADVKVTVKPGQLEKKPTVVATSLNDAGVSRAHVRVTACD